MTIAEKIAQLRPLIGYDHDKDVRDTIENPYDFNRAVEHAIRAMSRKAKISMRAVFVPFVKQSKYFSIALDSAGASGFEIIAPKKLYILTSDGSTIEVTEKEVESVVSDTYALNLEIYNVALRKLGNSSFIQTNLEVNSQPASGVYDSIASFPSSNIVRTTSASTSVGYYLINFSKANENKYSFAKVTVVAGQDLTLDQTIETDTNYLWVAGDKIYIVSALPYLMVLLFQGSPKINYFDTYTTIPIDDVYIDYIDDIALEYLYRILQGRFDKFKQLYITQKQLAKEQLTEVKKLANKRTGMYSPDLYIPYAQSYGR
jgi:hypothetical protein